jgi:hypothetical protein
MDKNKVLWHTIKLRIPSEMISIGKNGVMTVKQSLTKKNNISKRLKEPSVILESDPNITEAKIIDKGDVANVDEIKERQGKLKKIRKKLEVLPNKPVITKTDFIEKSKEKVAPRVAQRKEYTKNVLNVYTKSTFKQKALTSRVNQEMREKNIDNWLYRYLKHPMKHFDKLDDKEKYFLYQNYKNYDYFVENSKYVEEYYGPNTVMPHLEIPENVRVYLKSKPKRPPNYSVKEMRNRFGKEGYFAGYNKIQKL